VDVTVRGDCVGCDAALTVYLQPSSASPTPASPVGTDTGNWYAQPIFARLTPSGPNAADVTHIEWFVTGSDIVTYGHGIQRTLLLNGARWVDVPLSGTSSDIIFWAVAGQTVGPQQTVNIKVDLDPPTVVFHFFQGDSWRTEPSGFNPAEGTQWWNKDVEFGYTVVDDRSGSDDPGATKAITGPGRNLSTVEYGTDRVGHTGRGESNDPTIGGRVVNIDLDAPELTAPADLELLADIDGTADVPDSFANGATAIDDISGLRGEVTATGEETVSVGSPVIWTFTATDWAGNVATARATVTAVRSRVSYTGSTTVQYGSNLNVSATVEPTTASGSIKFTLLDPLRGNLERTALVNSGRAETALPNVLANVGTYTLRVEYVGDFGEATATAQVTVTPTPFSVVVTAGQRKEYGEPDPPSFAYSLPVPPLHPADVVTGELSRIPGTDVGPYGITIGSLAINGNYQVSLATPTPEFEITARPLTVTADDKIKLVGAADPPLTYAITSGSLVNGNTFSGALTRATGETPGDYAITQGTLTLGPNYALTVAPGVLSIVTIYPGNNHPVAQNDTATAAGAASILIAVLSNDSDPDGDTLTVSAVTQPDNAAGTTTLSGNLVRFTPTPGFVGTTTFSYTVIDGKGGLATATVTVEVSAAPCLLEGFVTHTQGGWGSKPRGNNPGQLLKANFALVYPTGTVRIGGAKTLTFTTAKAIENFLPQGGKPGVLTSHATNPTKSSAGVLAGQVLALQLNVDFSRAGITKAGLGDLLFDRRYTVNEILAVANQVLGGNTAALAQLGLRNVSELNEMVDAINNNFASGDDEDDCHEHGGRLTCPGNQAPNAVNDTLKTTKNTAKTISVIANDRDPDGDSLEVMEVSQPAKGSVISYPNGTINYTPPANWTGTTSFTYVVSDGQGGTDTATVSVTVASHVDDDDCDRDWDGKHRDRDDHNRDHDDDRDHDHDRDCDREHSSSRTCNDNRGWYNWKYR
jgi:hypothetical protein